MPSVSFKISVSVSWWPESLGAWVGIAVQDKRVMIRMGKGDVGV